MYKCPHCEAEINHLLCQEDATIYGTFDIETQDYEQEDTDAEGGLRYKCPECHEGINSIDDLIDTEEEERQRERLRERQRERNRPTPSFAIGPDRSRTIQNLELSIPYTESESTEELPVPPAIEQSWRGEYSGFNNSHNRQKQLFVLVCPNCKNKNETLDNEEIECYNCHKKLNQANAQKVIPIENN